MKTDNPFKRMYHSAKFLFYFHEFMTEETDNNESQTKTMKTEDEQTEYLMKRIKKLKAQAQANLDRRDKLVDRLVKLLGKN